MATQDRRSRLIGQFSARAKRMTKPSAKTPSVRTPARYGRRDTGLGQAAAQITASTAPSQFRQGQAPTPAQTASWMQTIGREKAPTSGGRAYSTFAAKNTQAGNPRAGQQYQTFVKRDKSGDIYRYHQYTGKGGRRVVRVGGPVNRELH